MRRTISVDAWPRSRTMVEFGFGDITGKAARWWLVVDADTVEVCDFDPGYDLTARVDTDLRTLTGSGAATSIGPQHFTPTE